MSKNRVVVGSLYMDLVLSIDKMSKTAEAIHGEHMYYMMGGIGNQKN